MTERLWIPAYSLRKTDLEDYAHTALVDTQPPFKNNRFSPRRRPDILIDHHPRHCDTQARLALIDESVGATTTILAEALRISQIPVSTKLATAMVYGIASETQNLGREAGERDVQAYLAFLPKANLKALSRIVNVQRPASFFSMLSQGIQNAFTCRRIIGVHLGNIPNPDRVAQMADFLLTHEKMQWSMATGRYNGRVHVSLRTTNPAGEAGRLLKRLLGGGNRGGGHRMIAGGSIEVGSEAPEQKWQEAENSFTESFLKSRGIEHLSQCQYPFR
jgi:nanoRNase/pAp phosphatase (c-di-AMP/oligoRNAs hydrolase)